MAHLGEVARQTVGVFDDALAEFCIHELVEQQAVRTPNAIAVEFEGAQLTYSELNERANQLAHYLEKQGVGAEMFVAVCIERSLEMIVAIIGILKSGGAYLPLDPAYPAARLAHMVNETKPVVMLTQEKFRANGVGPTIPRVYLDASFSAIIHESIDTFANHATIRNLAYAMYTSGSTGTPRAVLLEHRGVVNHNLAMRSYFELQAGDRVAQCTSLAFDISVEEIFPTLISGATLVLHPGGVVGAGRDFCAWLRSGDISVVDLPTAFWHEWVSYLAHHRDELPEALRLVIVGGQKASAQVLATWTRETQGRIRWVNGYGPTEITVASIFYSPDDEGEPALDANADIPIGRPIHRTDAHILDLQGEPCAVGETGELCISGAGVARGYLGQPELTAQKFVVNPFSDIPGERLYRTGDVALLNAAGLIEFVGRIDDQVKVRGFRVELGEVENALRLHADIHDVAVIAREDSRLEKRLAAYVVLRPGTGTTVADIICFLKTKLPAYMVPSDTLVLDALPLTPTGKTDKQNLPVIRSTRSSIASDYVAPASGREIELAKIWSEVLGVDEIGLHDNFFDLGGHSLRAAQVASRIRNVFGLEIPLAAIFAQTTIADLAGVVDEYLAKPGVTIAHQRIPVSDRHRPIPLSFSQERVWFLQQLDPTSLAYNFQTLLQFSGALNIRALHDALSALVQRHEILRTSFTSQNGVATQRVHEVLEVELPLIDFTHLPPGQREAAMQERIGLETARAFDMAQLPLIRWTLFRRDANAYALLHIEHHLIHDGWSFNVFRRELLDLYLANCAGAPSPLAPLPIQFADFALWQREWLSGPELDAQLSYWKRKLANAPVLELPTDRARPLAQSFKGAVHEITLSGDLYESLRAIGDKAGATLFNTLQATFMVLLHRYSGQDDISIGTGIANRRWSETESMLGMLVNNVVLRSVLPDNPSFLSYLSDVRNTALEAFAHQDAPFDHIVRAVGPATDASRNPLFQVMFSFHDSPLDDPILPGIEFSCVELVSNRSAKFDLNIVAVPHAEQRARRNRDGGQKGITLLWEYNTALFDAQSVEQLAAHYEALLQAVAMDPGTAVLDLPILNPAERQQLLVEWNDTAAEFPMHSAVHELFEQQAVAQPDAIALVFGDRTVSYHELNVRANQLGRELQREGVTRGAMVGVYLERGVELMIGVLAILKCGAAYVPLDPGYPDERLAFVVQDTRVCVVLTDTSTHAKAARWNCTRKQLSSTGPLSDADATNLALTVGAEDCAYVIHTSGSTGRPKGVAVPHRGIVRLLFGNTWSSPGVMQRVLQLASLSFDSSTYEIWGPLVHGGTCVLHQGILPTAKQLGDVLRTQNISALWLTSPMFNSVVDEAPQSFLGLKELLVGGEALSVSHVRHAQALLPDTILTNGYGPTESTTFACCYRMLQPLDAAARSVPIGRPIANTRVYILDSRMNPVPIGVAGELYIAGDGLALGYLGHEELTAERFVADPFGAAGSRLYRTGDFARYRRDALIEFVGRADDQVKIRGYRIELGEIENVLREQPGIRDAAAMIHDVPVSGKTLVGYVVLDDGAQLNADAVRDGLARLLPPHMIPTSFVVLDLLPLSPTGKLSRKELHAPQALAAESRKPFVAPITDIESAIAKMWCDVLQLDRVSINDNFFDLGGHSLLATRIIAQIQAELSVRMPLRALFEFPTVAGLASHVSSEASAQSRNRRANSSQKYLFPLNAEESGAPIFFLPGGHGGDYEFLVYARLVHFVGEGFKFYGLRARSADGIVPAHESVEQMVTDYLTEIRVIQPHGPYRLVGNCIGGVVAFEMGRQLERAGEEVRTLVMMDTDYPTRAKYLGKRWTRPFVQFNQRWSIGYYAERSAHHLRALRSVPWSRKWSYIAGKSQLAIRDTAATARTVTVDPAEAVLFGYQDTLRRYVPGEYGGAIDIIINEREAEDAHDGWASIVRGEIAVHIAPGDHDSYIRENVQVTARQLKECLVR
ncbi:MAG: amino acid adenylation domain-containing protein [Gemmatimonadaceae bacterium]